MLQIVVTREGARYKLGVMGLADGVGRTLQTYRAGRFRALWLLLRLIPKIMAPGERVPG